MTCAQVTVIYDVVSAFEHINRLHVQGAA